MDRLKQMESFALVAAKGNLTAAAQAEGVAAAVMGRRIDALESRLGVKLLVRTTRRLSLTPGARPFWKPASACWPSWPRPGVGQRRWPAGARGLAHHRAGRLWAAACGAAGAVLSG